MRGIFTGSVHMCGLPDRGRFTDSDLNVIPVLEVIHRPAG